MAFSIYSSTQTSCISCSVTVGDRPDAFGEPVHHAQHQQRDVGHLGTFYSKMLENLPSSLFRIKEGYVLRNVPTKRFQICHNNLDYKNSVAFFPFLLYVLYFSSPNECPVDIDQDINEGRGRGSSRNWKMKTNHTGFHRYSKY